jgi:hypothetical protein
VEHCTTAARDCTPAPRHTVRRRPRGPRDHAQRLRRPRGLPAGHRPHEAIGPTSGTATASSQARADLAPSAHSRTTQSKVAFLEAAEALRALALRNENKNPPGGRRACGHREQPRTAHVWRAEARLFMERRATAVRRCASGAALARLSWGSGGVHQAGWCVHDVRVLELRVLVCAGPEVYQDQAPPVCLFSNRHSLVANIDTLESRRFQLD